MKEFKDQTNRRFSNLATTIERSQQTFNVLKHHEILTVRCTVRTCDQTDGLVLGLRLSTTRKTENCPSRLHPTTNLFRERLSSKQDGTGSSSTDCSSADERRFHGTATAVQRRHSPTTHKRLRPRRLTASDDLTDDPTRLTTTTNSADQR